MNKKVWRAFLPIIITISIIILIGLVIYLIFDNAIDIFICGVAALWLLMMVLIIFPINFRKRKKIKKPQKNATLTVNGQYTPVIRKELEEVIDRELKHAKIGEVLGGKNIYKDRMEVDYCEIYLHLNHEAPALTDLLARFFTESMNLPRGSVLQGPKKILQVGSLFGLGLYFNLSKVPDNPEMVEEFKKLAKKIRESLDGIVSIYCSWIASNDVNYGDSEEDHAAYLQNNPTIIAYYIYGRDYAEMKSIIEPLVKDSPFSDVCRIEKKN